MPKGIKLWIILKGQLVNSNKETVANVYDCFGDAELVDNCDEDFNLNIIAQGGVDISEINKAEFE
jgi:hypothetical protein